jgi:hypothetical protein
MLRCSLSSVLGTKLITISQLTNLADGAVTYYTANDTINQPLVCPKQQFRRLAASTGGIRIAVSVVVRGDAATAQTMLTQLTQNTTYLNAALNGYENYVMNVTGLSLADVSVGLQIVAPATTNQSLLSAGAIAGIVIAAIAGIILGFGTYVSVRRVIHKWKLEKLKKEFTHVQHRRDDVQYHTNVIYRHPSSPKGSPVGTPRARNGSLDV